MTSLRTPFVLACLAAFLAGFPWGANVACGQGVSILEKAPATKPAAETAAQPKLDANKLSDALGLSSESGAKTPAASQPPAVQIPTEELPLPAPEEAPAASPSSQSTPLQSGPPSRSPGTSGNSAAIPPRQPTVSKFVVGAPMHEAFVTAAQPVVPASVVVPFTPPPEVDEQPSSIDRQGTNMGWIAGYWAWHDDMFVWITGMNREIPPGRRWVPGRWSTAAGGYQWNSGFWADANTDTVLNTPRPPQHNWLLPPSGIAQGSFWMPSGYQWQNNGFILKQGYSSKHQDKFIWQPSQFVQTPNGFVFVSGYWDFELSLRGTPLAPTAIARDQLSQPLQFTPNVALTTDASLLSHLFFRRGDHHVYFTDFASAASPSLGLTPWYAAEAESITASPLLSYYRWKYERRGINFDSSMAGVPDTYRQRSGVDLLPGVVSRGGLQVSVEDPLANQFSSFDGLVSRRPAANQVAQNQAASSQPNRLSDNRYSQQSPVPLGNSALGLQAQPRVQLELRSSARVAVTPFGIIVPLGITPARSPLARPPLSRSPVPRATTSRIPTPSRIATPLVPIPTPATIGRPSGIPPFGISPRSIPRPPIPGPGFRRFGR